MSAKNVPSISEGKLIRAIILGLFFLVFVSRVIWAGQIPGDSPKSSKDTFNEQIKLFFSDQKFLSDKDFQTTLAKAAGELEAFLKEATEKALEFGLNIDEVPSTFIVFDRQSIERTGATTIAELLRFVPGLEVIRENNGTFHLIVRGNYSDRRVLILWDGQPLNVLLTRRALNFIGAMPVDILERIEISLGPSSAVYGSYAMGGVINLIPRKWANGGEVGGAIGSFDSRRGFASGGLVKGDWDIQFSVGASNSDGDSFKVRDVLGIPGEVNTGQETNWQELRLKHKDLGFKFFRIFVDLSRYYGITDRLPRTEAPRGQLEQVGGQFTYDFELPFQTDAHLYLNWRQNFLDYGKYYVFHPAPPETLPAFDQPTVATEKVRLRETIWGIRFHRHFGNHCLFWGAETLENAIRSVSFYANRTLPELDPLSGLTRLKDPWPKEDEEMWAIFLQDQWQISQKNELNFGLRYDKYSGFSGQLSPRIVWIHRLSPKFATKLIYGRGFRVPDLNSLYNNHKPLVSGNPDLKPEKLDSIESVFIWKPDHRQRLSLSMYHMWLKDVLGRRAPSNLPGWHFRQGGDERVSGGEISYRYRGLNWDIYLYASYQWGENEFDEPRPYVANVLGGGFISYSFGNIPLEVNLGVNYVGSRWREKYNPTNIDSNSYIADPRPKLKGYTNVNLKLIYDITKRAKLWLGITNLFNDNIRYPSNYGAIPDDYRENGRYAEVGLRIRF